jgi:hypothetical protein
MLWVTAQSWDRNGLPSETLKLRIMRERGIGAGAEGDVLRGSMPWFIAKMCPFKFSPERPLRS